MHEFIEHLVEDHSKQRELGNRLKEATEAQERKTLREQVAEEVLPHMAGEEASIFPYMKESGNEDAKEHALEAIQEHHVGRLVMQELMELNLDSEVFSAKASVLFELNEHHMKEEEEKHFPWIEQHASSEKLDGLYEEYEAAEEAEK